MARPKKGAPRPDTVLVTFRLGRSLVAALDEYATSRGLPTRSDAARELMKRALANTTIQTAPSSSTTESRVLEAGHVLTRGISGTFPIATLRAHLADVERTDLDQALRRLDASGAISLGRAVDLASLTPDDREAAIRDDLRGLLVYVSTWSQEP